MNDSREDEVLKELQAKENKIVHLSAEMERLVCENTILRQKVDALLRQVFGAKSEQIDKNQLLFLLQSNPEEGPAQGKESGPEASKALLLSA
ncbi:MAG: hypothetical protein JWL59_4342 [Chthoniobacteraceae bacterium]|nr:hypothetical protein [Chthoniobacteraceae bacterium]